MSGQEGYVPAQATAHDAAVRLRVGLKHQAVYAPWDGETLVWDCSFNSTFGVVDGWLWATDNATALAERAEGAEDSGGRSDLGKAVLRLVQADMPAPLYSMKAQNAMAIGGQALIPPFGYYDLDRVRDAIEWLSEGTSQVVFGVTPGKDGTCMRIVGGSEPTRLAAVMGIRKPDQWVPTIELPVTDQTLAAAALTADKERVS